MQIQKFDSFINENKQQENKVNNLVDITVIKPDAQKEDILSAIDLAREYNYYGVVVQPEFVDFLSYEIENEFKYISFFAIEDVSNLTLKGFKYELKDIQLSTEDPLCISNENEGRLSFKEGLLLVVHQNE